MNRTKVFSYPEVTQRMGDKTGMGSETDRGSRNLDGGDFWGKYLPSEGSLLHFF